MWQSMNHRIYCEMIREDIYTMLTICYMKGCKHDRKARTYGDGREAKVEGAEIRSWSWQPGPSIRCIASLSRSSISAHIKNISYEKWTVDRDTSIFSICIYMTELHNRAHNTSWHITCGLKVYFASVVNHDSSNYRDGNLKGSLTGDFSDSGAS